jgi:sugar lactone lactonase YvrE
MKRVNPKTWAVLALVAAGALIAPYAGALAQTAPRYLFDPTWPKPMPNNWKLGGATGLAVDANDNVWVYNRPNDLTRIELFRETNPPIADCCVRPPSMVHIDKNGNVIGSFDAPQGHGMDVDSKGFVYLGQDTVRKYDPKSGKVVGEIARTPTRENGQPAGLQPWPPKRNPGEGGAGPVAGFAAPPGGRGGNNPEAAAKAAAQRAAFRKQYPPETPMIVGNLEEIRVVERDNEIYVADSYLGGRILVFDMGTLQFKRGWGAYGKPLNQISIDDSTREYTPNGPMAKDFVGHLTVNVSNDGLVYAADRNGNRIHVTDKQGKFIKEFILKPGTGEGGSTGGVAFSPDREQRLLYISDLTNNKIWFLNREDGKVVGEMGGMGENGGQWFGLHMIAVDSVGNIYTGEVFAGQRVQRFVPAESPKGKLLDQLARMTQ